MPQPVGYQGCPPVWWWWHFPFRTRIQTSYGLLKLQAATTVERVWHLYRKYKTG